MGNNLFAPEYSQGNLETIDFIADKLGLVAVILISTVGFGIVIATILKNALHGLYAVSPKFWDRVYEAKQASLRGSNSGGNEITKLVGSISIVFLSCLPNVKALTDFEDEVLDAKAYFMKAIPLACVHIFIGVFIFFGYPAQVAEKFSDFGRGLFDVVLMNVDPLAWVQSLPEKFAVLSFSTDGSESDVDKAINKISKAVTNAYIGELDDMTKDKRIEIAPQIEKWVIENTEKDYSTFCNTDKYKMSVTARVNISEPNLDRVHGKQENGIYTFAYAVPMDNWEHGVPAKETAGKYIRYDLVFTPVASKGDTSSVDNIMSVANKHFEVENGGKRIVITVPVSESNYGISAIMNAEGVVNIDGNEIEVKLSYDGNSSIIVTPDTTNKDLTGAKSISQISGLFYNIGTSKHAIREIVQGGGDEPQFRPKKDSDNVLPWDWGSGPNKKDSNSDEIDSTEETNDSGNNSNNVNSDW